MIKAYRLIDRGRRRVGHMGGVSGLPICIETIEPYLRNFEPPIDRQDFIWCMFEMDNAENGW